MEKSTVNLGYQVPHSPRPAWFLGRVGAIAGTLIGGIVIPLILVLFSNYVLHDTGEPALWPVIAIGGGVLGWLLGVAFDSARDHIRDRKVGIQTFDSKPSWRQRLNQRGAKVVAWITVVAIGGAIETRLLSIQLFGDQVSDDAVIERNGGFKLTSGVRDVKASIEGWQDPTFRARLVVRPADLPAFLQSAAVSQPRASSPVSDELKWKAVDHFTNRWWTPRLPPTQYAAGEATWVYRDDDGETWDRKQLMLIDETDPAQYIVWIVAYHV